MILHIGTDVLSVMEPALLLTTWFVFMRGRGQREFPAFGGYLACRALVYTALTVILHLARSGSTDRHSIYGLYYYVYWIGFLLGAGLAFLAIQEVFRHLMRPLPGLGRYGVMVFRWVSLISGLIALAVALYPVDHNKDILMAATGGAMRCVSALELCLLAFIVLSMQTLRLSPRSREFGIALGLAMIAAADLFGSAFAFRHSSIASLANYTSAAVMILSAAVWLLYFVRPEPTFQPMDIRKYPQLERWNEIAGALGQPMPQQIVIGSPADFFLQDVEKAVDRVLEKNSVSASQ